MLSLQWTLWPFNVSFCRYQKTYRQESPYITSVLQQEVMATCIIHSGHNHTPKRLLPNYMEDRVVMHESATEMNRNSFCSTGAQGDEIGDVKFNGDGDRIGRYSIFQYQKVPDEGYKYIQVGEFGEFPDWTYKPNISRAHQVGMTQQLALNTFIMQWPNVSEMGTPPLSVCSHSCRMGHIKSFTVSIMIYEHIHFVISKAKGY